MTSHADQYASIFSQNGYDSQKELAKRLQGTPELKHLSNATITQYVNNLVNGRKAPSEQLIKGLRRALPKGNLSEILAAQYGNSYNERSDNEQATAAQVDADPSNHSTPSPPPDNPPQHVKQPSARQRVRAALDDWVEQSLKTFRTEYEGAGTIIDKAYLADRLHHVVREYQAKHGKGHPAEGDHS